jgi:hypothetical protein
MSQLTLALLVSAFLSVVLSFIQVVRDAKIYSPASILTYHFLFLIFLTGVGNVLTTLLAATLVDNSFAGPGDGSTGTGMVLKGPLWIWYAFFGVFGFEVFIQKLNITFFDKGVLSINDWITKAKDSATAATLEKAAAIEVNDMERQAEILVQKLSKSEIHTHAASILGLNRYQEAIASVANYQNVDPERFLASMLTNEAPKKVKALIQAKG